MGIRVLYIGEIVGKAGVFCIKQALRPLKEEKQIDFVIANGEGTTGGFGIGKNHSIYLHKLGIDVITAGEKVYFKKDMVPHITKAPYILRPANYPPSNPGRGWRVFQVGDRKIGVICLLGQSSFSRVHLSNPFTFLPELVSRVKEETNLIILDFHASTTAEKYSMFHHADGLVSAVIGSHTKVLTADEHIKEKGTAVICDSGRTGSFVSVGGLDPAVEIQQFLTQIPERSNEYWESLELQGVIIEIGDDGRAEHIERVKHPVQGENNEGSRNGQQN
ncbi:MAG: TIGR00282 family metallophosphoesterase [Spirochaetota bacterium]|nr:TIGR00282 family metallophosphoesterase [Spirochaetota bacterium]